MSQFNRYSGIVVKNDEKILFCKRAKNQSLPNVWSIPSGKIEKNELPNDAAIREFYEETNIKIPINKIKLVDIVNFYDGKIKKGLMYLFLYKNTKMLKPNLEKAKDGFEHTECGYFTYNEVPKSKKNDEFFKKIKKLFEEH